MPFSMINNFTDPYSPLEAWIYDTFVAGAVTAFAGKILGFLGDLPEAGSLLDVGCGGGQNLLEIHRQRPDLCLTGLDLSAGQIARATKRSQNLSSVHFVEGSALELPFENDSQDAAISIASIKHWPNQTQGLKEIFRVIKPGGLFLVVEVDRACTLDDCRTFVKKWHIPKLFHPLGVAAFRTWVAGHGPTLQEMQMLASRADMQDFAVEHIQELPGVMLTGCKAE